MWWFLFLHPYGILFIELFIYLFIYFSTFLACWTCMLHMTTSSSVCPVYIYTSLPVSVNNSLRKAAVGCQNVWSSCDLASVPTSSTIWVFLATQAFIVILDMLATNGKSVKIYHRQRADTWNQLAVHIFGAGQYVKTANWLHCVVTCSWWWLTDTPSGLKHFVCHQLPQHCNWQVEDAVCTLWTASNHCLG